MLSMYPGAILPASMSTRPAWRMASSLFFAWAWSWMFWEVSWIMGRNESGELALGDDGLRLLEDEERGGGDHGAGDDGAEIWEEIRDCAGDEHGEDAAVRD